MCATRDTIAARFARAPAAFALANLLAEVLEKRCGASSSEVAGIFPGITNDRLDVVHQRAS